ncbi:hypothetical protein [Nonomuraea polychroma]|uniref:hypothetical protein n=1 Tax=Nonomuraea polychroma TaxID=46176 RepID=UPI000FDF1D19|nr:hypothetical protein [Nonomuraea polychroma]
MKISVSASKALVLDSLLRSPSPSALAVAAWAMYETLMPHALGGGRAPAYARRCWVADALGVNEKTLDGARRQLLASGPGGSAVGLPHIRSAHFPGRVAVVRAGAGQPAQG